MIDTDKYKDMHGNQIDVDELLAEIKRLREVAYRKDMQVGERDKEVKRLREGLQEMVNDFETKKTDKWRMLNHILVILKGDD